MFDHNIVIKWTGGLLLVAGDTPTGSAQAMVRGRDLTR